MKKKYLLTPGPVSIPPLSLLAQSIPIIHHRTSEYREIFKEINENLKYIFQTQNPVYTFTASGTGAMETAVVNLLNEKDKVIVVRGGKFGERWTEICNVHKVEVFNIDIEYGDSIDPNIIEEKLKKNKDIKAVFTTLCETSTGALTDIKTIASFTKKYDTLLVVDAISGLAADELKTDEWEVDVVVTASQKALMTPPGLSFITLNEKAWRKVEKSTLPKYYFNLKKAKSALDKQDTAFTPAVSLILSLQKSLEQMKKEGIENIILRHKKLAQGLRAGIQALGLKLFAKFPANAVTAIKSPPGIDASDIIKIFSEDYGITIAGGQNQLKGKIFRIALLGYVNPTDVVMTIAILEIILSKLGYSFKLGEGIKATEEIFLK